MIQISSTKNIASAGVNILVYGQSGAGKTSLIRTLNPQETLVVDVEAGLLPLAGMDYPVVHVKSADDFKQVFQYLMENPGKYKNVAVDSISEAAEYILADEEQYSKDGRMPYSKMGKAIDGVIKALRDLKSINVICLAKSERTQDDSGKLIYSPSLPGQKAAQNLPYPFDEVFCLRVDFQNGKPVRHLQTSGDGRYTAKDRSGKLAFAEEPDLSAILKKIQG